MMAKLAKIPLYAYIIALFVILIIAVFLRLMRIPPDLKYRTYTSYGLIGLAVIIVGIAAYVFLIHPWLLERNTPTRQKLRLLFTNFLTQLKQQFPQNADSRYTLPWYVIIGNSSSGKTKVMKQATDLMPSQTITQTVPIALPQTTSFKKDILEPATESEYIDKDCTWNIFEHGAVLDVPTAMLYDEQGQINTRDWLDIIGFLQSKRYRRPLDGVILNISCKELLEAKNDANAADVLIKKAEALHTQMIVMHKRLGMFLPVYVLVTQCDALRGFESFCPGLPPQVWHLPLGWSNNRSTDEPYSSEWIDEAFQEITPRLHDARFSLLSHHAEHLRPQDKDGLFLISGAFQALHEPLRRVTDILFRFSSQTRSYTMRGIYFTGEAPIYFSPLEQIPLSEMNSAPIQAAQQEIPPVSSENPPPTPPQNPQQPSPSPRGIYFSIGLLFMKIFPEHGLAYPLGVQTALSNKKIRLIQYAALILLCIGLAGIAYSYFSFREQKKQLIAILREIEKIEKQQRRSPQHYSTATEKLLQHFARLNSSSTEFFFLPSSWFAGLDDDVRQEVAEAYHQVILKSMYTELVKRVQTLPNTKNIRSYPTDTLVNEWLTVEAMPEYGDIKNYVDDVKNLHHAVEMYNSLAENIEPQYVFFLSKYIYNIDLPEEFFQNTSFYSGKITKNESFTPIKISSNSNKAFNTKLTVLLQALRKRIFEKNVVIFYTKRRFLRLDSLTKSTNPQIIYEVLSRTSGIKEHLEPALASPEAAWITKTEYTTPKEIEALYEKIDTMRYFTKARGKEPIFTKGTSEQCKIGDELAFRSMQEQLFETQYPTVGSFYQVKGKKLVSSPIFNNLSSLVESLQGQSFMNSDSLYPLPLPQANMNVTWNPEALNEALAIIKDYQKFMSEAFPKMPNDLKDIAKIGTAKGLEYSISKALSKAYSFEKKNQTTLNVGKPEDKLRTEVQGFKILAPKLSAVLAELRTANLNSMAEAIEAVIRRQASSVLSASYRMLDQERLYTPSQGKSGSADATLASTMFNTASEDEIGAYLATQRDRITDIATHLAEPLVNFSINQGFATASSGEPSVVQWQKILLGLRSYANKSPGNSLARLEGLITELNTLTPATVQAKLSNRTNTTLGGDTFFAQRWNAVRSEALRRASFKATSRTSTKPIPGKKPW